MAGAEFALLFNVATEDNEQGDRTFHLTLSQKTPEDDRKFVSAMSSFSEMSTDEGMEKIKDGLVMMLRGLPITPETPVDTSSLPPRLVPTFAEARKTVFASL